MSHGLRSSGPIPARYNLSAAPPGNVRPLVVDRLASSTATSAASTARAGAAAAGGSETDRAFAAVQARMSPKASPIRSPNTAAAAAVAAATGGTPQQHQQAHPTLTDMQLDATPSGGLPPVVVVPPSPSRPTTLSELTPSLNKLASPAGPSSLAHLQVSPSSASLVRAKPSPNHGQTREKAASESKEQTAPTSTIAPRDQRALMNKRLELEEELRVSIQRKDEYIAGLQRNCETLSALCAKHMQQVTLLKADLDRTMLEKHVLETDGARSASNEALTQKLLKENDDLTKALTLLTAKHETLQAKMYAAQHQLSELTDQKEDLTTDLTKERTAAHGLRQELEEMKAILNSDAQSTKNSSTTAAAADKEGKQQHEFEKKLVHLKKEHESNRLALEHLSQAYRTLQKEATRAANMVTRLEQEKTVLESDVARWKKQAIQAKRDSEKDREVAIAAADQHQALTDQNEAARKENATLVKRVPELEAGVKAASRAYSKLRKEHDILWSTNQDLVLQFEEAKAELALAKKQVGILGSNASAPAVAADPDESQASSRKHPFAEGELLLVQEERRTLGVAFEALQQRYTDLEGHLGESDLSLEKWKGKYEASKLERAQLAEELETARADLERARVESTARQHQLADASASEGLKQSLLNSTQALTDLEAKYAEHDRDLRETREEAKRAAQELHQAREKLAMQSSAHSNELAALRSQSEQYLSQAIGAQEKQLGQLQKQLVGEQHRNAELQAVLDQPRMSAGEVARLLKREKELQATIAKLVVSEEASETSFTCFACVRIFTKPVTCVPCGHSYCLECIEQSHVCQQCRPPVKVTYYANELLEELSAKYIFRKQALAALKEMTNAAAATK